jgi:hypothetical protein
LPSGVGQSAFHFVRPAFASFGAQLAITAIDSEKARRQRKLVTSPANVKYDFWRSDWIIAGRHSLTFISIPTSPWMANGGAAVFFLGLGLLFISVGRWLKSKFWYLAGAVWCCLCFVQLYFAHRLIWNMTHFPTVK